jgi:hypothetical protein
LTDFDIMGDVYEPVEDDEIASMGVEEVTKADLSAKGSKRHEYYCLHCEPGPERKKVWFKRNRWYWCFERCIRRKANTLARHMRHE